MPTPNPLAVMKARTNRLAVEAAPRWYQSDARYTGHMVGLVAAATDGSEPADPFVRTYSQPQTGAVLTVGTLLDRVEYSHEGPEGVRHDAYLNTYALVEKPKRVMVQCTTCGEEWDEKR